MSLSGSRLLLRSLKGHQRIAPASEGHEHRDRRPPRAALGRRSSQLSEAVKNFNGRDALLRVRDGRQSTGAEHRVPTGSGLYALPNVFTTPLSPNPENMLGEREPMVGLVTQGAASRDGGPELRPLTTPWATI